MAKDNSGGLMVAFVIGALNLRHDAGGLFASVVSASRSGKNRRNENKRDQKLFHRPGTG